MRARILDETDSGGVDFGGFGRSSMSVRLIRFRMRDIMARSLRRLLRTDLPTNLGSRPPSRPLAFIK